MTNILTVGEFCTYLAERLALKNGIRALPYRRILARVVSRLESEYKIPRQVITEQAQFAKDLGLG